MTGQQSTDSIFELVCYLISAARLSLDEAPRYGSTRLLVAASRLISVAEEIEGAAVDDVLRDWRRSIDANMFSVMDRFPEYVEWLSVLTRSLAEEATERNLSRP